MKIRAATLLPTGLFVGAAWYMVKGQDRKGNLPARGMPQGLCSTGGSMLVENWMATNVIAVKPDTSLLKCRNLLKEHQIRRLPVVDDQNRVVGIISDRDVKGASPSKATALEVHEMQYLLAELKAKDIMTAKPVTIKPWDSVEQAAILMMDKKFGGLPVVSEDNKLVGIITDQDIFKLLINITGARVEGMQFAFELSDTPGSMRVIFDTLRKHDARIISVLSSYMEDNKRQIYVRIRSMEESAVEALVKDLEATGTLLLAAPYDV